MKHKGLDVAGIRRLVAAADAVKRDSRPIIALLENVGPALNTAFDRNRKLPANVFSDLVASCRAAVPDNSRFSAKHSFRKASLARPGTESFESCFFGIVPISDDIYRLLSLRIAGDRRRITTDIDFHPLAFSYHVAERMQERLKDCNDVFAEIASELVAWYPAIRQASRTTFTTTGHNFNIPVPGAAGALVGDFEHVDFGKFGSVERGFYDASRTDVAHLPRPMGGKVFVLRTFVDRFLFSDRQSFAMKSLTDWHEKWHVAGLKSENPFLMRIVDTNIVGLPEVRDEARLALARILQDPIVIRSMHADRSMNRFDPADRNLSTGEWATSRPRTVEQQMWAA